MSMMSTITESMKQSVWIDRPYIVDPETALPKVERMIYKMAWEYAQKYPVTFEEARSEAYVAFIKACKDFGKSPSSKRMCFTSWAYYWIWTDLKTWITKRSRDPLIPVEIDDDLCGAAPDTSRPSLEALCDITDDAREVLSLLLETPDEIASAVKSAQGLLKGVKAYLVARGRNKANVEKAVLEIKTRLQEAWAA